MHELYAQNAKYWIKKCCCWNWKFLWKINTILNVQANSHHGALCCSLSPKLYKYKYNYKAQRGDGKLGLDGNTLYKMWIIFYMKSTSFDLN